VEDQRLKERKGELTMDTKLKTIEQLGKLWDKVPELTLAHLISLSVRDEDTLYQMSDDTLIRKVGSFVAAMENQKNIRK
jgi:hypothetical protein